MQHHLETENLAYAIGSMASIHHRIDHVFWDRISRRGPPRRTSSSSRPSSARCDVNAEQNCIRRPQQKMHHGTEWSNQRHGGWICLVGPSNQAP
jgi:hypothetical protein